MDFFKELTNPLGAEWCDFYYFLMVIVLIVFILQLLSFLYGLLFRKGKGMDMKEVTSLVVSFMMYFTYRMFYSMCLGSLSN